MKLLDSDYLSHEYSEFIKLNPNFTTYFSVDNSGKKLKLLPLNPNHNHQTNVFGFVDPSNLSDNPGWPLRNYLILINYHFKLSEFKVLCYRESKNGKNESLLISIRADPLEAGLDSLPKHVGWEKDCNGKTRSRMVDLAPLMNPLILAETAVDLNLKLMRWRILPDLNLDRISQTKCLLLGSGTLGCYVARLLLVNLLFLQRPGEFETSHW